MKAIAKIKKGKGLKMIEAPVPRPAADEVLIQVDVVSICGTDLHLDRWDAWAGKRVTHLPQIIGHEFSGHVVETGKNVKRFQIGDPVTADSHIPCLKCAVCLKNLPHLCNQLQILGIDRDGCFAEYVVIPSRSLWENAPELPPEIASIQDPLGNAVYATLVEPVEGQNVVILGDGPVGLFAAGVARASGAEKIILTGLNPLTLKIAEQMGVDRVIHAQKEDVSQIIRDECEGVGADVLLEMSGNAQAISDGLSALRKGGRFCAFGLPSSPVPIDFSDQIIFKGIRLFGISGRLMFKTWRQMAGLLHVGKLNPRPVLTHFLDFDDFEQGFALMEAIPRLAGKVVLVLKPAFLKEIQERQSLEVSRFVSLPPLTKGD
ncbi:L-threonine 3-dehydrogenase [hydrothermal vent metagenome]|uniref:L-threonine 3-dehydrogenase n=1 Tax=hydrothermal vent metagenome TaxID=652676 RepID=A0A3B1CDQ3_9ZZZZ